MTLKPVTAEQHLLYGAVPAAARSGTRPWPVHRTVPCRSSECRGFGGCDRLHCRKTSECEGRGGRNCYRRLFLVSGKSWRRGGAARQLRLRGNPRQPSDWKEVSESERVKDDVGSSEQKWRKHFVYSGFSSRPQQVSNWERWQCSLLVDEWHLRRLSILLLLLELSKLSKLCLSISQILAWPPVSTTKLRTSSDLENFFLTITRLFALFQVDIFVFVVL